MKIHQKVTPEIISEVRVLITDARHASLAVLEAGTGDPFVSRVAVATRNICTPVLLTSALAPHTGALQADGRCALMIGEPGKGDPMAHPRVTLSCTAHRAPAQDRNMLRELFLNHHPKARNYVDLPDFGFWHLVISRASYNAGFGKAYPLTGQDLTGETDV